ncbi:hypothetical protein GCM10011502_26220 [Oceanisphaera marina]|uniref:DUF4760 domain-containing protein n=1 Tax=Oceanisphaera marina TaxID=2017550 RepID=A0ABQ1IWA1_9GAMM|nr:DUF4760 domain-containing protein [Oceanisphaera marina]GGB51826.1 hypothetical protein GCM10011502_26220 [Oceanisphaera marina]
MLEVITAIGALLSGTAASAGIFVAYKVHQNQKLLSQRQLLLPLWEHMATLSEVNPTAPITPDIIKVVNTLELVALCCEGGMIDEQVIRRTFKEQFMMHYESVERCVNIPGLDVDGKKLLRDNRAAFQFYQNLENERLSSDKMRKT